MSAHTPLAAGAIRGMRAFRHADLVVLALLFAAALTVLGRDGILSGQTTYSDETQHLRRAMAFAEICRGGIGLDRVASFYGGGIWPPLYPALMGAVAAVFDLGLHGLRVVNMALVFVGLAAFTRMTDDPRLRMLSLAIPVCLLAGTNTYFQVRPENLAVLLVGLMSHRIARSHLFASPERGQGQGRDYATLGALAGLTCLTHAVFALCAVYLTVLAVLRLPRRWLFVAGLVVVAGPYFLVQNAMHEGLVLFATTAEENLARNNNPFLRTAPRPEADDQLFAEMERRYAGGDRLAYPRPAFVPAGRYAQWLHDENKRRIFKEIALTEMAAHPADALRRAGERVVGILAGDPCLDDGRYGCLVSATIDRGAYALLVALGLAGAVAAGRAERRHRADLSFFLLCCVLLMPMVLTQALVRHFVIVLLIGAYGGLFRLGSAASGRPVARPHDGAQVA